jgi:lipoprotein-anchoring transpeptidase ErfK/SrfK
MLTRRDLLGPALAALGLAASRASALEDGEAAQDLPPEFQPVLVSIPSGFAPGEIHVDPDAFALYWTLPDDQAIRYAVGIGRAGLYHPGTFFVGAKKEWPSWTPTPDMVEREPERYGPYAEDGMPGGPDNPLGARALYLFTEEEGDTFLRIHGTNAPHTIGTAVSNGCARLLNEHIVDLYERVPLNAPVVLYPPTVPLGA